MPMDHSHRGKAELLRVLHSREVMIDDLTVRLAATEAERDAYKKAKQENDERFMTERDAARADLEQAQKKIVEAEEERDEARERAQLHIKQRNEAEARIKELERTFNLMDEANRRGIKKWQAVDPEKRSLVWPDQAKLVTFLLETIDGLEDTMARDRKAAAWCETHRPNGGARSDCLVCTVSRLMAALSAISYACGPKNDMNLSAYDVDCDEKGVVSAVREKIEDEQAKVKRVTDAAEKYAQETQQAFSDLRRAIQYVDGDDIEDVMDALKKGANDAITHETTIKLLHEAQRENLHLRAVAESRYSIPNYKAYEAGHREGLTRAVHLFTTSAEQRRRIAYAVSSSQKAYDSIIEAQTLEWAVNKIKEWLPSAPEVP